MILKLPKNILLMGFAMLVGTVASTAMYLEQDSLQKDIKPATSITLAATSNPESTLVMVADRLGYFRDEGLEVRTVHYRSGKAALETMLQGRAQFATSAETPVILNILRGKDPVIIAGIFNSDRNIAVIARRDRGIKSPGDLRGKRIGVTLGTNGEYFLHALLAVEGVPLRKVNIIDMPPSEMAGAMAGDKVDAVCVWHPFLAVILAQLGDNGASFYGDSIYTYTFNVASPRGFINRHPDIITAFLRALEKSEKFVLENPGRARRIVAETGHWDPGLLDRAWGDFTFQLSLDSSLTLSMDNQARWAMASGLVPRQEMPDALDFIYLAGLQTVAPRDVTILQ